jgi:hypothetical protein
VNRFARTDSDGKRSIVGGVSAKERFGVWLLAAAVAIGGAVVAVTAPSDRPHVDVDSTSAWLSSVRPQVLGRVNALVHGPFAATTAEIGVPLGSGATTVRRGSMVIVTDPASGNATVVDVRTRRSDRFAVAAGQSVEVVDRLILRIDGSARQIIPAGTGGPAALTLSGAPGSWREVSGGALWLTIPSDGSVVRIDATGSAVTVPAVFRAGEDPPVAAVSGGVALLDRAAREVVVLTGAAPRPKRHAVKGSLPGKGIESFDVASDGSYAIAADAGFGAAVTVVDLTGRRGADIRQVGDPGHDFGAAVLGHDRIYFADRTTGALVVLPARPGASPVTTIDVARRPARLEVFRSGSVLWANDPDGPNALAVNGGDRWPVIKYVSHQESPTPPPSSQPPRSDPPRGDPATSTRPTPQTGPPTSRPPGPGSGPEKRPGGTDGPPGRSPTKPPRRNTAKITNLKNNSPVSRCQRVTGTADLEPTKALLLASRRTNPSSTGYFVQYVKAGNVGANWGTTKWFGTAADQSYDLVLLVMDVDDARAYWNSAQKGDGYVYAGSLPPANTRVQTVHVRQTVAECGE